MATKLLPWKQKNGDFQGHISTNVEIVSDEYPQEGPGGARKKSCGTRFHGNYHVVMTTKKPCFCGQIWAVIGYKIAYDVMTSHRQ